MKYIFFGTPEFAVIILKALMDAGYTPTLVVAAPDKPKGRGRALAPPPVKTLAEQYGIPIIQPATLKDAETTQTIAALEPDLFIVAAYGAIIPKILLDIPKKGGLNIHPSLLPKYRGPSPVQAAILHGDETTGVTIILMDEKMDHGPILAQRELTPNIQCFSPTLNVGRCPTAEELSVKLANLGAQLLIETIPKWLAAKIVPQPQDHHKTTYTKLITKEDGRIDWRKSAEEIERMVRAYTPWPSAWTIMSNTKGLTKKQVRVKILRASLPSHIDISKCRNIGKSKYRGVEKSKNRNFEKEEEKILPGAIIKQKSDPPTGRAGLLVACGDGLLHIEQLHIEGNKPMSGMEFLNGYPFARLFFSALPEDPLQPFQ